MGGGAFFEVPCFKSYPFGLRHSCGLCALNAEETRVEMSRSYRKPVPGSGLRPSGSLFCPEVAACQPSIRAVRFNSAKAEQVRGQRRNERLVERPAGLGSRP